MVSPSQKVTLYPDFCHQMAAVFRDSMETRLEGMLKHASDSQEIRELATVIDRKAKEILERLPDEATRLSRQKEANADMIQAYVNEVWLGEWHASSGADTVELLNFVREKNREAFDKRLKALRFEEDHDLLWLTLQNLYRCAASLFSEWPSMEISPTELTIDLAKNLHRDLMRDLKSISGEDVGEWRKTKVHPHGSNTVYANPADVTPKIEQLFDLVVGKIKPHDGTVESLLHNLVVGAWFFVEFLLIHPFLDGNGRTARVLMSLLVSQTTVVPISLYRRLRRESGSPDPREYYMTALEHSHNEEIPCTVIKYVFECAGAQAIAFSKGVLG